MATIAEIKELAITQTPLVLFDCELSDGSVKRWSTHRVQVLGEIYEARVLGHNLFDMRAGGDEGSDSISRVALTLANADSNLSQIARDPGLKGARLSATFLFYDVQQGTAASEGLILFRGIVNPPDEITEATMRLSVTNRLNLQRLLMPQVRIQRRCPWAFPSDAEQRLEAYEGGLKGKYSLYYRCGYSADIPGGRGSMNNGQPFTSCDYTRKQCVERGMFDRDGQARDTRRFGGIEYVPASTLVRGHGEPGTYPAAVLDNQARYNDLVPLVYGTAWIQPPIVTARNDGNLTRMEVLLGCGEISRVIKVVVNDAEIPAGQQGTNMTATGWFNLVTAGNVTGAFNLDLSDHSGQPIGDPYGSMALLSVVVPNGVSEGKTLPRVVVFLDGLKLPVYNTIGYYLGEIFSRNPAWIILDILRRCGWTPPEIDLASFATAAGYCDEDIASTDLYGNPVMIPRYSANLAIRRRRSAADLLRGVRNCAGLYLTYGPAGLLELRVEERISIQQALKPLGSNSISQLSGGWPAYEFGDGTGGYSGIARRANGESSVRLWFRSTAESPNRYTLEFQDEFNEYQQDSLSLVDIQDAIQGGQEVSAVLPALGVSNFHQAARLILRQLNKSLRGNLYIQFETSVRAVGLRPGDIITVTYVKEGLLRQPFRIQRIAPGPNHRSAVIEAQIHDDGWYTDSTDEGSEVARRQGVWGTGVPRPLMGSTVDVNGIPQFGIEEVHQDQTDGTVAVALKVSYSPPAKPALAGVQIPHLSLAPLIDTAGGALAGGTTYYYAVSAVDGAGAEGSLSFAVRASIPSGTNTNRVTLDGLEFSANTGTFHVYRGSNPSQLFRIAENQAVAGLFTDGGLVNTALGPPDENFDHAKFEWRRELHPEVSATLFSSTTIGNDALLLLPNEFAGMIVRITQGRGNDQERVIAAHDQTLLTVTSRWEIIPDGTSRFVIGESAWHFGATGTASPLHLTVPNRAGSTIHVTGAAVNARGVESIRALSSVTRWQIGGSPGVDGDSDIPSAPILGVVVSSPGAVEIVGVSFADPTNTRTIHAGTLTFHFWDELQGATTLSLAASIDEAVTIVSVAGDALELGNIVQIDSELLEVEEVLGGGSYTVRRGAHDSATTPHASTAGVYRLKRKVYIIPFPKGFFGSPASGSFSYVVRLPNARLAAAEMFVTNQRGNSETNKLSFTAAIDQGIRTYSGGQFTIQVDGNLAIQTGAAPPLVVESTHSIRDIHAVVREAPTGAPVELALRVDGNLLCALTIPVDATTSQFVNGFGLPPLQPMSILSLDVVSVGFTANTSPGRDLTVTVRL
jgi:hypothetical protein